MVFKSINGMAPAYLSELCIPENSNSRQSTLRSATSSAIGRLKEPKRTPDTKFGERAFSVSGPKAWNKLPYNLRLIKDSTEFRAKLKTYLFGNSYP